MQGKVSTTPAKFGTNSNDTLEEATGKYFQFQFNSLLKNEVGCLDGDNANAIHDMRVAIRRMRTALEVFSDKLKPFDITDIEKELKKTARRLGKVRDLDVLLEKTSDILESLPSNKKFKLDSLTHYWRVNQRAAVLKSSAYLKKSRYNELKAKILNFIAYCSNFQSNHPFSIDRVDFIAPICIYQQLACVRAYGSFLENASVEMYHQLRIETKKLRYTIEFFQDVLGQPVSQVLDELKKIQDHLGDINDDVVAVLILNEILSSRSLRKKDHIFSNYDLIEIRKYCKYRDGRKIEQIKNFHKTWGKFDSEKFRKNLAMAISNL